MSAATAPPPHLNGSSAVPPEVLREADFLQKLLQIRDEVFASKHPRIHLPAKVVEQVAPRPSHATSNRPTTNGISNTASLFPPRSESGTQHTVPTLPPTQRPFSAKSSSSSIDPVLLTKSEHLIKAELQLKRQQIERTLKDQFDRKGRGNDTDEREALINVEECLNQALLRVPPVSGLLPANNSDDADSFDGSYYSSQANSSWSSDEVDHNADAPAPLTSQVNLTAKQVSAHTGAPPTVIDLDEEAYEPADDIEIYEPEAAMNDDVEEEDYSPPPADIGPSEPARGRARDRGFNSTTGSRRQSPSGPAPAIQNPRKRRREEKRDEKRRQQQQQANKKAVRSPEPFIKEEPQSPPPFVPYQELQPSKRRALQPADDVELVHTPESARTQPIYYREQEPSLRPYREYEEPSSPTVIHAPQRRAQRDDQDLRRVASLQYARRPYSPNGGGDVFVAPVPRPSRAASHAFVERAEQPVYREVSSRPSAAPRYVRERSRSPIQEYIPRQQSPVLMAPPSRRIVVDQYGNKFYAAPVDVRESMAPPSRRVEVEPYYERASTREPTLRAPVRTDIYEDEPVHMMPPPPRRYVEAADADLVESPSYRQRAVSRRPVEVEYRQVPQYEDMGPPREYLPSRAYSMRPEVIRQDMPTGFTRHEGVQPVRVAQPHYREVSIVQQEPYGERRYVSAAPQGRRYVEEEPIEIGHDPYAAQPPHTYTRY